VGVEQVDQRALTEFVFLSVGGDDLTIGVDLALERRNLFARDRSRGPGFIDRRKGFALQPRVSLCRLDLALAHFNAAP